AEATLDHQHALGARLLEQPERPVRPAGPEPDGRREVELQVGVLELDVTAAEIGLDGAAHAVVDAHLDLEASPADEQLRRSRRLHGARVELRLQATAEGEIDGAGADLESLTRGLRAEWGRGRERRQGHEEHG